MPFFVLSNNHSSRHGLSYTTFTYSNLQCTSSHCTVDIHNSGSCTGSTVAQLYISPPSTSSISRPLKELKGFTKVSLEPGENKTVEIALDSLATSFWDEDEEAWRSEKGVYGVQVGESSADIRVVGGFEIEETTSWTRL